MRRIRNDTLTVIVGGVRYEHEVEVEASAGTPRSWDDPGSPGGLESIIGFVTTEIGGGCRQHFTPTESSQARLARHFRAEIAEAVVDAMIDEAERLEAMAEDHWESMRDDYYND